MIHIDFDPNTLEGEDKDWWQNWKQDARKATLAVIECWKTNHKIDSKRDFDSSVWKAIKDWMLEKAFHHKCAYCEAALDRQVPEAEHFRPKAGVSYKTDYKKASLTWVSIAAANGAPPERHPGYFWLAYHWKNLFPACKVCNCGQGKNNQFPALRSHVFLRKLTTADVAGCPEPPHLVADPDQYLLDPDSLDHIEDPLLLNPFVDQPREHIIFGKHGIVKDLTEKGRQSIEVFNLKADGLMRLRDREQREAESVLTIEYGQNRRRGLEVEVSLEKAKSATIALWHDQNLPHFAAVVDRVERFRLEVDD